MKVAVFSSKPYDKTYLDAANIGDKPHRLVYFEDSLTQNTVDLSKGYGAVCVFVNDIVDGPLIKRLHENGVKLIVLRCTGFNNVDINAANSYGIRVVRVTVYSPYAVAEYTVAMILTLNRKTHRAFNRVRDGNFSLNNLIGFDLHGKTVGVIGTGKIGVIFSKIMMGFGCRVLAYDPFPNKELVEKGVEYRSLDELYTESDIITLKCPLTPETYHIIDREAMKKMKNTVMLINSSRGGLIDAPALVEALKNREIGYLGIDVYEQEESLFYHDLSDEIIEDDVLTRLIAFPNVLVTSHQAFFTDTALNNIAETTIQNITDFEEGNKLVNEVKH
ncbi:MAG TPA: hydroxyacid dehydrogenase [Cytophagales bacterium]|jgi:D-lactate dehydrogenase|nr:hydroxyacid dehydrogenase [Cytophagales bacterium]